MMDGWMDEYMNRLMEGWMIDVKWIMFNDGWIDVHRSVWTGRHVDGQMDV